MNKEEMSNHREAEPIYCATCNHAGWSFIGPLYVKRCNKHDMDTHGQMVCDDWEREQ